MTPSQPTEDQELRDYDYYFDWQLVALLRSLGIMNKLSPAQIDLVTSKAELLGATIREDMRIYTAKQVAAAMPSNTPTLNEQTETNERYPGEKMNKAIAALAADLEIKFQANKSAIAEEVLDWDAECAEDAANSGQLLGDAKNLRRAWKNLFDAFAEYHLAAVLRAPTHTEEKP